MSQDSVTLEEILYGVGCGRSQSVGNMEVIPLVDEGDIQDENLGPPEVEVGTSDYGTVNLRNDMEQPTIVPPGAGWVVKEAAQDHAIGGGTLIGPGKSKRIDTARCIQSRQSGTITRGKHEMLILPAQLRTQALALRKRHGYSELWDALARFNAGYGRVNGDERSLAPFLQHFKSQLDQFVAEFELVPKQIGAIVLVNGALVGIELAPNERYWAAVWTPLIRVCYGSWSIRMRPGMKGPNRHPLDVRHESLAGIQEALSASNRASLDRTSQLVSRFREGELALGSVDGRLDDYRLITVGAAKGVMGGQLVRSPARTATFLSLCIAAG